MPLLQNSRRSAVRESRDSVSVGWKFLSQSVSVIALLSLGFWNSSDALKTEDVVEENDPGFAEASEQEFQSDLGRDDDDNAVNDGNATHLSQDQSYRRTNQRFRELRTNFEHWFIKEIQDIILNATGRANATRPPGLRQNFTGASDHGGPGDRGGTSGANERISGSVPARRRTHHDRRHNVVEMKFTPDEGQ